VTIPVVTGATGIVTKVLRKHLEATRGKHSTASLQTTATLGISHKIRKVLQCENGSLSVGDQLLVQEEKYRREEACDKGEKQHSNNDDDDDTDGANVKVRNIFQGTK
jgi:hypothetical protein